MKTAGRKSREGWEFGRAAVEELGKIIKSKDVWLETKAKIIHLLVFPVPMYGFKSWTAKKADKEKLVSF